jgi:hypothetical protein
MSNHADALDTAVVDYDEVVSRIQFHSQQMMLIMNQIAAQCQQPASESEESHDLLEDLNNCVKKFCVKAGVIDSYRERFRRNLQEIVMAFYKWKNSFFFLLISVIGVL